jgi:DNA-binding ferritin-like protein (Dps family)
MRANIPRTSPRPPANELEGIYLQAMKEVSVRLMEALPAGDELWQMLGQVESMLLEAQLREMPLPELFGNGGVAAFCQSIVDEYKADGEIELPAARDRRVKSSLKPKEPRGGINAVRYRRTTVALAAAVILLLTVFSLWYTGILRYWTGGSSYYLEELHNFRSTSTLTATAPLRIEMPLEKTVGLSSTLYSDGEGFDITLTSVETYDHIGSFTDPETGKTTHRKMTSWCLRVTYAVESDFRSITYVEPSSEGTVTVTLRNGAVYEGKITWIASGQAEDGREYARISVIELPADLDTEGATLTVVMESPYRVEWNRFRVGPR